MIRGYLKHNKISFMGKTKFFKILTYVVVAKIFDGRARICGWTESHPNWHVDSSYPQACWSKRARGQLHFHFFWVTLMTSIDFLLSLIKHTACMLSFLYCLNNFIRNRLSKFARKLVDNQWTVLVRFLEKIRNEDQSRFSSVSYKPY